MQTTESVFHDPLRVWVVAVVVAIFSTVLLGLSMTLVGTHAELDGLTEQMQELQTINEQVVDERDQAVELAAMCREAAADYSEGARRVALSAQQFLADLTQPPDLSAATQLIISGNETGCLK